MIGPSTRQNRRSSLSFSVPPNVRVVARCKRRDAPQRKRRAPTLLDGSLYGSAKWLWKLNGREEVLWVQIVFARLVDNANLLVLRGLRIGKNLIDLSPLKGHFIALVL